MKMRLYKEAQDIAVAAKFPPEVRAEISKACADFLYGKKSYEEAIDKYIETIGFLNPSYVIQRYIQVPQLDNLIKYLEKLIRGTGSGTDNRTEAELATMADYNKDYTALLLNCYVKKEKFQAI